MINLINIMQRGAEMSKSIKNNGSSTATIGFEQQIWKAADILRGNIDASEYKHVILGLIFLKYISDKFDERYQQLLDEGEGFEEDIAEHTAEHVFFVPPTARIIKCVKSLRR